MNPTKMLPSERHGIPLNSISSAILDAERHPTTTKHTPGPWYAKHQTGPHNQGLIISEATGANVAVAYDWKDAAVLASAPAMLDALTRTLAALEVAHEYAAKTAPALACVKWAETETAARAAIAQATGGEA